MNILRKIKYFLIGLLFGIFLIVISSIVITVVFEKEVTHYVIKQLNKHLNTKVIPGDTNFSILKKFPYASLEFKNITIMGVDGFRMHSKNMNRDTLLNAKSLYLQFNVLDILRKDYRLKSISIENGFINLLSSIHGEVNYHFWKDTLSNDTSSFKLDLSLISLEQISVFYFDEEKKFLYETTIAEATLKGKILNDKTDFEIAMNSVTEKLSIDKAVYFSKLPTSISVFIGMDNDHLFIKNGHLGIDKAKLVVSGDIINHSETILDLHFSAQKQDLSALKNLIPESVFSEANVFKVSGLLDINLSIVGKLSKKENPHVEANFEVFSGLIEREQSYINMQQISAKGNFSNGKSNSDITSILSVKHIDFKLGGNRFDISGFIKNFKNPVFQSLVEAKVDLEDLQQFLKIDTVEQLAGKMAFKAKISGNFDNNKSLDFFTVGNWEVFGDAVCDQVDFKFKRDPIFYRSVSGKIRIHRDIAFDSLSLSIGNNRFFGSGNISNGYKFLFQDNQNIAIDASMSTEELDFQDFLNSITEPANGDEGEISFPDFMTMNLNMKIDRFQFNKLKAENVKGMLTYKPRMFVLNSVTLETMDGKASGNGAAVLQMNKDLLVHINSDMQNINIQKLFQTFDNFGQSSLQDKHLKGMISGNSNLVMVYNSKLKVYESSITLESDIEMRDGELIGYEPMLGLSKFIDVKELQHIKFATLKNSFYIKERQIFFPQMEIVSNAISLYVSGTHNFDNYFDYRVRVLLSDVLFKKSKSSKAENSEFVEIDDTRKKYIPLRIVGTFDKYDIKYDKKRAREDFNENLTKEKTTLKTIFKEEYGWFKSDTSLKKADHINSFKGSVIFEDEDIPDQGADGSPSELPNKEKADSVKKVVPKFEIEWEDE